MSRRKLVLVFICVIWCLSTLLLLQKFNSLSIKGRLEHYIKLTDYFVTINDNSEVSRLVCDPQEQQVRKYNVKNQCDNNKNLSIHVSFPEYITSLRCYIIYWQIAFF